MRVAARNKIFVEYRGEKLNLSELAERIGLSHQTIWWRWNNGMRGEQLWAKHTMRRPEPQRERRPKPVDVAILSQFARLPVVRVE